MAEWSPVAGLPRQRSVPVILLALAASPLHFAVAVDRPVPTATTDDFCVWVQQAAAGTSLVPVENVTYTDFMAFRKSKTVARPLQTHQYVQRTDGPEDTPVRISCKVKTPDHLIAEYGPGTARDPGRGCGELNRQLAAAVYAGLNATERQSVRYRLTDLAFDPDITTLMGSRWVSDYPHVYQTGGQLHLQAKVLRVDWDNVWLSWAPDTLRGAWYCHLVAPEYLRQLVLGQVRAPDGP